MIHTILILDFENLSNNSEVDYIKKAVPLEITHLLSQFKEIRIISNITQNLLNTELGKNTKIDFFLKGTFIKIKSSYRFQFQLINNKNNECLLSIKLEEDEKNMFQLIDSVSYKIAKHLELEFLSKKNRPNINHTAYQYYLKGLQNWNLWNKEDIEQAIEYFKEVIELEPEFAMTYVRLAQCYSFLAAVITKDSIRNYNYAKEAANKAITLDKDSIDAYLNLALIKLINDVDILGAYYAFKNAFSINNSYIKCHHYYAYYLITIGKYQNAIDTLDFSLKLDPLNLQLNTTYGFTLLLHKKYNKAEKHLKKTLATYPESEVTYDALIWTYILSEQYFKAKMLIENSKINLLLSPTMQIIVYKALEDTKKLTFWRKKFENLLKQDKNGSYSREISAVYLALGDLKNGAKYFESFYKNKMGFIRALSHPAWKTFRESDKFYLYKKRLKLLNPPTLPPDLTKGTNDIILIRSSTSDFFTIPADSLLYIESKGVYCDINFVNNHKIHKKVLRVSLNKIMKDTLYLHFFRCHNSFIINKKAPFFISGNRKLAKLKLKRHNIKIPVSRSKFIEAFKLFPNV
ncbi:LytTR family transcriptional regulator DNA-binding domain-containing protein [Seonamhaeicola marinus]|uniref:LytTR family transcriptional regulator DNA-binding domain-containing protein n=1 Tax=Seonamhaeicola marinus TaxID=1912246 RepID=UPI001652992D|nr:LytTR family transcriptional regulator DNA-binding domain-containing protein [Seonamhaeicola marinus]